MNKCGKCGVCCKVCNIEVLNKPANVMCRHYGSQGCMVYKNRPEDCKTYQCIWVTQQEIDLKYRPDYLGVIFEQPFGKQYWVGIELTEGALQKPDCAKLINAMNNDGASVLLKSLNGRHQYSLPNNKTIEDFIKEINE